MFNGWPSQSGLKGTDFDVVLGYELLATVAGEEVLLGVFCIAGEDVLGG